MKPGLSSSLDETRGSAQLLSHTPEVYRHAAHAGFCGRIRSVGSHFTVSFYDELVSSFPIPYSMEAIARKNASGTIFREQKYRTN
jgi:hypothetical protein